MYIVIGNCVNKTFWKLSAYFESCSRSDKDDKTCPVYCSGSQMEVSLQTVKFFVSGHDSI